MSRTNTISVDGAVSDSVLTADANNTVTSTDHYQQERPAAAGHGRHCRRVGGHVRGAAGSGDGQSDADQLGDGQGRGARRLRTQAPTLHTAAMPAWICRHNTTRPHAALQGQLPISKLTRATSSEMTPSQLRTN